MAEFCKQCAEELNLEPDFTDLFKDIKKTPGNDLGFTALCEGCIEAFIIDDEGTCGNPGHFINGEHQGYRGG